MIRTTLLIPEALHQQMLIESRRQGKSFGVLARELFQRGLNITGQEDILRTYNAMDALDGMADSHVTDASQTIDDTLYGDKGVWQGVTSKSHNK